MNVKKLTPLLFVEQIEPSLDFWSRVGFEVSAQVPQGDALGFVILSNGGTEIMYQTRASVQEDIPELADSPQRGTFLYVEVNDIDTVDAALSGVDRVVPRRKTFYGADELIVREPAGNVVTFAQMAG